jgi:hypothetical protein
MSRLVLILGLCLTSARVAHADIGSPLPVAAGSAVLLFAGTFMAVGIFRSLAGRRRAPKD